MPSPRTTSPRARATPISGLPLLLIVSLLSGCQDGAGPPPTLDPGVLSFSYSGEISGTFTADGRCYFSQGYPAADSACALGFEVGDTLRLRGVRDPRSPSWAHANLDMPSAGGCSGAGVCRVALDFLSVVGKVETSYRTFETTVTIQEESATHVRGTFSGRALRVGGGAGDTIRITDGRFDVPVDR